MYSAAIVSAATTERTLCSRFLEKWSGLITTTSAYTASVSATTLATFVSDVMLYSILQPQLYPQMMLEQGQLPHLKLWRSVTKNQSLVEKIVAEIVKMREGSEGGGRGEANFISY